ncbi:MAG: restriction endonuclease, partial [Tagaea sp.]
MSDMWMIRSSGGELFDTFLEKKVAALGWSDVGDLNALPSREAIAERVKQTWPDWSEGTVLVSSAQLHRFRSGIKLGDRAITYDPSKRVYALGTIASEYVFDGARIDPDFPNIRAVEWNLKLIDRDALSSSARNSLGSSLSLFLVPPSVRDEFLAVSESGPLPMLAKGAEQELSDKDPIADMPEVAREYIKDRISKLGAYEAQNLVAGLLRAMGYRTQVSAPGADRGTDIVASPDGLGLQPPRIVVQVKHRESTTGGGDIREFIGGRHPQDRGLFVSKGGFTKDAKYEADRASIPIQLMDLDLLLSSLLD